MQKKQSIKVVFRKLGKEKAHGLAYKEERTIHVDERLKGIEKLDVIIHEIIHIQQPNWGEARVEGNARELARILWDNNLRFIE
jgi:predicted metallopeptidase